MSRILVFIGVLLATTVQAQTQGREENIWGYVTGLELKARCEFNVQFCNGYIASANDTISGLAQVKITSSLCIPQTSKLEQVVLVVKKYLDDNPDKLHFNGATLVLLAISAAFPCR
ncbi:MAG: Rap1a/Tai family immunity protein [Ferrovibrio sp.]